MKKAFTSATAEDEEGDKQSFSSEVREQRVRAGGMAGEYEQIAMQNCL